MRFLQTLFAFLLLPSCRVLAVPNAQVPDSGDDPRPGDNGNEPSRPDDNGNYPEPTRSPTANTNIRTSTTVNPRPTSNPVEEEPSSRAEVVYLANCLHTARASSSTVIQVLEIAYYADTNLSQKGEFPNASAGVSLPFLCIDTNPLTPLVAISEVYLPPWAGVTLVGAFADGVIFTGTIRAGADSFAVGQVAGSGSNGYGSFTCRRDNNRILYQRTWNANSRVCRVQYFCMR